MRWNYLRTDSLHDRAGAEQGSCRSFDSLHNVLGMNLSMTKRQLVHSLAVQTCHGAPACGLAPGHGCNEGGRPTAGDGSHHEVQEVEVYASLH